MKQPQARRLNTKSTKSVLPKLKQTKDKNSKVTLEKVGEGANTNTDKLTHHNINSPDH